MNMGREKVAFFFFLSRSRVRDPRSYAEQLARKMNCSSFASSSSSQHPPPPSPSSGGKKGDGSEDDDLGEAIYSCLRDLPADRLASVRLAAPSFHTDLGPSLDGVTVKDNFSADLKGKRNFGTRYKGFPPIFDDVRGEGRTTGQVLNGEEPSLSLSGQGQHREGRSRPVFEEGEAEICERKGRREEGGQRSAWGWGGRKGMGRM